MGDMNAFSSNHEGSQVTICYTSTGGCRCIEGD